MDFGDFKLDLGNLGKDNNPDTEIVYDMLVIGGGPASMTAAVYAARKMMKVAILTYDFGGQMGYTSEIENYMGFQIVTGEELVKKFQSQVEQFEVPILQGEYVTNVEELKGNFKVTTDSGNSYFGKTVIIATGKRDRKLDVPGEKELTGKGVAYCTTCDAPFYKDKTVAVAGGGNSAFTAVQDLLKVTDNVVMINFSEGWQADEVMVENAKKSGSVTFMDSHQVLEILGDKTVTGLKIKDRKTDEDKTLEVDGIFIEIGLIPNSEPVKDLLMLNEMSEVMVDCHCRTSVPGVYGAGDVTTVPYKQIIISAGEGAKAALAAYTYLSQKGEL